MGRQNGSSLSSCGALPLKGGDWCHFSARWLEPQPIENLKGAIWGMRMKTFPILAFKIPCASLFFSDPMRHPLKGKGSIQTAAVRREGIRVEVSLTKKNKDGYAKGKKVEFGRQFSLPRN